MPTREIGIGVSQHGDGVATKAPITDPLASGILKLTHRIPPIINASSICYTL